MTQTDDFRLGAVAVVAAAAAGFLIGRSRRTSSSSHPVLQKAVRMLPRATTPRTHPMPAMEAIEKVLPTTLPRAGLGDAGALDAIAPLALDGCAQLAHPGYFAHMDPASAEVACAAAMWQVTTNQVTQQPVVT